MIPQEDYETSLTKQEILRYLYDCLPDSFAKKKYYFNTRTNSIKVENHVFYYYLRKGSLVIAERKQKDGCTYDLILTPERKKRYEQKLKTKKGKIMKRRALIATLGTILVLSASVVKKMTQEEKTNPVTYESFQENNGEFIEVLEEEITIYIPELKEEQQESLEMNEQNEIMLNVATSPTDYLGFQKRENLLTKYQDIIFSNASKYGLDANFVLDLFSQESHNERDNVTEEEKNNLGQLTGVVCTEPIITPVFQDGVLTGYEGFFILPSNYPNIKISNLNEIDETYLTDIQKDNLKRAKNKENVSWNVYQKNEVFYDKETNITVSMAYLSYLVNKKEDLILGAMSYHSGYSKTRGLTREQVVNGEVEAQDNNYIKNIIQYEPLENYENGFTFKVQLQNGEYKIYNIKNPTLESEYNYEKENGYHL